MNRVRNVIVIGLILITIGSATSLFSFTDIADVGRGNIDARVADLIAKEENKEFVFSSVYCSVGNKCKVSDLFNVSVDENDIKEIRRFWKRIGKGSVNLNVHRSLREDAYENMYKCINSADLTKTEYKKIVKDGDWYKLRSEFVSGTILYDDVLEQLEKCEYSCDITPYIDVMDNSKELEQFKNLEKWKDWRVSYDQSDLEFTFNDIKSLIVYDNNKIEFKLEDLTEFTNRLEEKYNTVNRSHKFKTNDGSIMLVNGGTYGWEIDSEKEVEWLRKAIKKCVSYKDRVPEFSHIARSGIYGVKDVGNTYVEISLKEQHVWIYKNGKVVAESDCVTGTKGKNDTPTGVYYCYEIKPDGKWLVGDTYRTWVNKWVRLTNTGIGLHDAVWRSYFGGNYYKSNGSHGCINLPTDFANDLVNKVYFGMPVVIY